MTIDREKLIELLVQKTGYDREKIEGQLSELVNRILQAAKEGKSFEIEGFGTFHMEDGELSFAPTDELETEVNNKYAGMDPIELIGAYDEGAPGSEEADRDTAEIETEPEAEPEPEPEDTTTEQKDDVWGIDAMGEESDSSPLHEELSKARSQSQKSQSQSESPESEGIAGTGAGQEEGEVPGDETEAPEENPFSDLEQETEERAQAPQPEEEPRDRDLEDQIRAQIQGESQQEEEAEEDMVAETGEADESDEEPGQPVSIDEFDNVGRDGKKPKWEPAPELKDQEYRSAGKSKNKDTIGRVLIVLVIVMAGGVGGWFAYDIGLFSGLIDQVTERLGSGGAQTEMESPPQMQTQPPVPTPDGGAGEQEGTPVRGEEEQTTPDREEAAAGQQEAAEAEPSGENEVAQNGTEQASQAVYGLKGEVNPDIASGYTIVVHSLKVETRARNIRDQLTEEGYRAIVFSAFVSGEQYWRVGLGQFETISDAQNAADNLREPFRSNFFIKRIR